MASHEAYKVLYSKGIHTGIMEKIHRLWERISDASDTPFAGTFFAVMSTILLALGHFAAQLAIEPTNNEGVPNYEVVLVRSAEQALVLFPMLLVAKSRVLFGSDKWLHLFFMSCAGYSCYILLYFALDKIPLSIALTVSATCPFFATLFSICILKERFNCLETTCGIVSLLGVILIARPTFIFGKLGKKEVRFHKGMSNKTYELLYLAGCGIALIFGMARALYLVLVRKWGKEIKDSTQVLTVFYPSVMGLLFTPYLIIFSNKEMVIPRETYRSCSLFSVGFLTSIGLFCLTLALKSQNATVVGLIRNLEIVWAFILQYLVMKIKPSLWSVAGSVIIIIATMISPVYDKVMDGRRGKTELNHNEGEDDPLIGLREFKDSSDIENTHME